MKKIKSQKLVSHVSLVFYSILALAMIGCQGKSNAGIPIMVGDVYVSYSPESELSRRSISEGEKKQIDHLFSELDWKHPDEVKIHGGPPPAGIPILIEWHDSNGVHSVQLGNMMTYQINGVPIARAESQVEFSEIRDILKD